MPELDSVNNYRMKNNQKGFTYIEVMCAMVILLIGILAQLSALSFSILRQREAEQQNAARQIANSTLESIFAARDLGKAAGISSWEMINTSDVNENGLFVAGWNPVRQNAGKDGIQGTRDDACATDEPCKVGEYVNKSQVIPGFQRQIIITDIKDSGDQISGIQTVKKRRLEVKMRYFIGQAQREQSLTTVIADLPFYK